VPFTAAPSDGDAFEILRTTTDPFCFALQFFGIDNHLDPGDFITVSPNPVHNHVSVVHNSVTLSDQVFLFDTGAQLSILSTAQADALGLDVLNPETTISVYGAGGTVQDIPGFTIDELVIPLIGGGTLTYSQAPIYVLDVAEGIDGILGMNLFNYTASMVYDPFSREGPILEFTFFEQFQQLGQTLNEEQLATLSQLFPVLAGLLTLGQMPTFQVVQPALALDISAATIAENAGASAASATITRPNVGLTNPLTVTVAVSDASEATASATVVIPADAASVTFAIDAINDRLVDGPQALEICVSATGFDAACQTLIVTDNDVPGGIGVARPNGTGGLVFFLDSNGNRVFDNSDAAFNFGLANDLVVVGDWNRDERSNLGVARPNDTGGLVFSLDANGNLSFDGSDAVFNFGLANDRIVVGDWDGDGDSELGVARPNGAGGLVFSLDSNGNRNFDPGVDAVFDFGLTGDTIVVGDWTGDGVDKLGVARPNATGGLVFSLDSNGNLSFDPGTDQVFNFGLANDRIVVADWGGTGTSKLGVVRPNATGGLVFSLDSNGNRQFDPSVDSVFNFGLAADRIVTGDWPAPSSLTASAIASAPQTGSAVPTPEEPRPILERAIALWVPQAMAHGGPTILDAVTVRLADLPGAWVGQAVGSVIYLDTDAAGHGWFVDSTPDHNEEFTLFDNAWLAVAESAASERIDLLTVLAHELGHALGIDHSDDPDDVMAQRLEPGVRRLPTLEALDALFAGALLDDLPEL
jgi:hypothetical protein